MDALMPDCVTWISRVRFPPVTTSLAFLSASFVFSWIKIVTIASPFPDNCSGTHHERLLWRLHSTLPLMARTVEPSRWFMVMEEGCTSNTGGALSSSLHAVAKKKLARAICNTCLNFVLISVNLNKYKYTHKYGTFA